MKKKPKWKAGRKRYSSKEGYDIYAPFYGKDWPFLDTFDREALFGMIGDVSGKRILDVGAGTGRIVDMLDQKDAEIVAMDVSEEMLGRLKKKFPGVETVVGDAEELPFEDDSFDVVVATFLIVHLKRLDYFFDEVHRVLREGGVFILSNVNQKRPPRLRAADHELVIDSFYHRSENVAAALGEALFTIDEEKFVYEKEVWINQMIRAIK